MNFKITHICENLENIKWEIGRVAGVYNNCFNVLTENDELLTFFKKTDKFSTRAILTNACESMSMLPIADGMRVTKFENCIFAGNVIFDIGHPEIIATKRMPVATSGALEKNIEFFNKVVCKHGRKSPMFTDEVLSAKLKNGFGLLKKDLTLGFDTLIGLGVGLTPSCDDILSGMSAYFHLSGTGKKFNKALSQYLDVKGDFVTTAVSKNLLSDVANGYINQSVYDLVCAVMRDETAIEECALRLIDYGSTSGTETCAGIIAGYLLNKEMIKWL